MPMKTIEGYSKEKYTDASVLLAGGGAKALSDFIGELSWDNTNKKIKYTPIGKSETDLVTLSWDNISGKPASLPANGGTANALASTGYGSSNLTYFQTADSFFGNSGWCHYIIANHGDGSSYYNFTIGLPFWGVPIYKRLEGGTEDGWHTFVTSENIGSQSVKHAESLSTWAQGGGGSDRYVWMCHDGNPPYPAYHSSLMMNLTTNTLKTPNLATTSSITCADSNGYTYIYPGYIQIRKNSGANPTANYASIEFTYSGGQAMYLGYSPNDSYRPSKGLKVFGDNNDNSNCWFEVEGEMYANGGYRVCHGGNSSVSKSGQTLTVTINGTSQSLTNTDSDQYVNQSQTDTPNWRGIVLGYNNSSTANSGVDGTVTNVVYTTNKIVAQSGTGSIIALGRGTFAGLTSSSGDLLFNSTNHIVWNSGSWWQRIFVTDDSVADSSVFTFQQSENTTGSSWKNLFNIRDNGVLDTYGRIERQYNVASSDPALLVGSNNFDVIIWKVYSNDNTYSADGSLYGYSLKYLGTGSGNDNKLALYADNQTGTKIAAYTIQQNGTITFGQALRAPGFKHTSYLDNSYVLQANGGAKLESSLSVSSANTATSASYLPAKYDGGDKSNPQYYFNENIGVRVAMTRYANIGGTSAWFDTLWINGYSGSDVPNMVALTTIRNGTPRAFLSAQSNRSTTYGTYYEIISSYNIGSQNVNYANSAGSTSIITRTWERGNNTLIDLANYHSQTRVFMADSSTTNKPSGAGAGFIISNAWDWGGGGSLIYQDFDSDYGRLFTNARPCEGSYIGWKKVAWTSDIPNVTDYYWANVKVSSSSNDYTRPQFGEVTIYDGTNSCLVLKTKSAGAYAYLAAYNSGGQYGADVILHSGSAMVLGAGESAAAMYSNNVDSLQGGENLYLTADGYVKIFTNCDSIGNRKQVVQFDTSGYTYFGSYINIGGHEKNASSPTYVWGSNNSDSFLRSYATSSLSVGSAYTLSSFAQSGGTEDRYVWHSWSDNSAKVAYNSGLMFNPDNKLLKISDSSGFVHIGNGYIKIRKESAADPTANYCSIEFSYNGGQEVYLGYTPNDSYRASKGLKVWGSSSDNSNCWFEVEGNTYCRTIKVNRAESTTGFF